MSWSLGKSEAERSAALTEGVPWQTEAPPVDVVEEQEYLDGLYMRDDEADEMTRGEEEYLSWSVEVDKIYGEEV